MNVNSYFQSKKVGNQAASRDQLKIQRLWSISLLFLFTFLIFDCQNLLASQEAIIVSENAIIYADKKMSAPVGYVRKGKRVRIGSVARNRAQVYPIVVSGKVAYVRSLDVSPVSEASGPQKLMTERFSRLTKEKNPGSYSVSYFSFFSQASMDYQNADLKDGDGLLWQGISLHGATELTSANNLDLFFNGMKASVKQESFNALEVGLGFSHKAIELERFNVKLEGQGLVIPFSNYAYANDFRVNGYGYTLGGGLRGRYLLTKFLGLEITGGFFYTKMMSFSSPKPYKEISPSFVGSRVGLGLSYDL